MRIDPRLIAGLVVASMALAAAKCSADELSDLSARIAVLETPRAGHGRIVSDSTFLVCYGRRSGETIAHCELVRWRSVRHGVVRLTKIAVDSAP